MTRTNMAICFFVKHGVKFIRNLFRRVKFALKILKSFAPVIACFGKGKCN